MQVFIYLNSCVVLRTCSQNESAVHPVTIAQPSLTLHIQI
jgi:hypothetical protein